jgi:hypothetical protein
MKQRFAEKIASAQRLFDVASSKDDAEVDAAVEEFRRSTSHGQDRDTEDSLVGKPKKPGKPSLSAGKLKPAAPKAGSFSRLPAVSQGKLKKVKPRREEEDDAAPPRDEVLATEAMVQTTPPPSHSKIWPVLAVVVALVVGGVVWKLMQGADHSTGPDLSTSPVELPGTDLPGTELPGTELPGKELPGVDPTPTPVVKNGPEKVDPPPKEPTTPRAPKERGDVTLWLIPEATVAKGSQKLGTGTMVNFTLPVGTHLVTVTGSDGVRHKLSLRVGAGKNKPQKYRLEDLPTD